MISQSHKSTSKQCSDSRNNILGGLLIVDPQRGSEKCCNFLPFNIPYSSILKL